MLTFVHANVVTRS